MNPESLVDAHPEIRPHLDERVDKVTRAITAVFEVEQLYPLRSLERDSAFRARCELGVVQDSILRDLGIRGR